MSKVGESSSFLSQQELLERAREDYKNKLEQLNKQHKSEVDRLSQTHADNIDSVNNEHSLSLKQLQNNSTQQMTMRDEKYRQDMESLKRMYQKQNKDVMQRAQSEVELAKEGYKNINDQSDYNHRQELTRIRNANKLAVDQLKFDQLNYNEDMADKYSQSIKDQRRQLQRDTKEQLSDQQTLHKAESVSKQRQHQAEQYNMRNYVNEKELEWTRSMDKQKRIYRQALSDQEEANTNSKNDSMADYKTGLNELRNEYVTSIRQEKNSSNERVEKVKKEAHEKYQQQIEKLKSDIRKLKASQSHADMKLEKQHKKEIENYRQAFQDNVDVYKKRTELIDSDYREQNIKDVHEVRDQMSRAMSESEKYYKNKLSVQREGTAQVVQDLKTNFETKDLARTSNANNRILKIEHNAALREEKIRQFYKDQIGFMQEEFELEKQKMREQIMGERDEAVKRIAKKTHAEETKNTKQMQETVLKYEQEIDKLRAEHEKLKNYHKLSNKKIDYARSKQQDAEINSLELKHKQQVEEIQKNNDAKLAAVKRNHEQQMKNLTHQSQERIRTIEQNHQAKIDRLHELVVRSQT